MNILSEYIGFCDQLSICWNYYSVSQQNLHVVHCTNKQFSPQDLYIGNDFGSSSCQIVSNEFLGNQSKKIKNKNFVNLQLLGRAPWWQKLFIIDYYWEQWLRNLWISLTFRPLITFLSMYLISSPDLGWFWAGWFEYNLV